MALGADLAKIFGCLTLSVLLASCSSATSSTTAPKSPIAQRTTSLPAPEIVAALSNAAQVEYHIGPLDLLEISVFKVPELSKTMKVNASGEISLPLIGKVQAGGKTAAELESEIAQKLAAGYLQSPQVTVFVKEATSQRVTVDGSVAKSGLVNLTGQTTLLQTIAMSGGLAKDADPRGILVFRTVQGKRMVAKFDMTAIRGGTAEDPVLYGGDVVVVDSSALRSALGAIRQSIPLYGFFSALAI